MQIEWPLMLYTFLACIGGGFIQTTTGFGFGISSSWCFSRSICRCCRLPASRASS